MKQHKVIYPVLIIVVLIYYFLDSKLYYYGKSNFAFYNFLPRNINPDYPTGWGEKFTLEDQDGLNLTYWYPVNNRGVFLNKVLKYSFDKNKLIAIVTDSAGRLYTLKLTPPLKKNYEVTGNLYIGNKENEFNRKWISIDDHSIDNLIRIRFWITVIFIVVMITFLYRLMISAGKS